MTMTKQEKFLSQIKYGCLALWKNFGILPSVAAGQAALESGWGQSELAMKYNNLFGIKGEYEGNSVRLPTTEFHDGKMINVVDEFRSYPNWSTSILDYGAFLTGKDRYKDAIGVKDYRIQIERIHKAGYATDPNYSEKVIRIIEEYDLHKWDLITFIHDFEGIEKVEKPKEEEDKEKDESGVKVEMSDVMLDAGHGGTDNGATGNGLREKDLNLAMALRVGEILTKDYEGIKIHYTRTTDKTLSLKERSDMANKANVDFFMSFHINAGGGTGYEDYIYDKLATNGETDKARQKIHEEVKKVLNKYGVTNRGMKKANFHVLRETKMKAVLVETLFIDNANDAELLKNETFHEDMAQAYAAGIAKVVGGKKKPKSTPQPNPEQLKDQPKTLYRVQVGAFKNKENADKLKKELEQKEINAFIRLVDGLYKVQVGAYSVKANAEKQKERLEKLGYKPFITK